MHPLGTLAIGGLGLMLATGTGPGDAIGACFVLFVLPGLQALVCWLVINCFKSIPRQCQIREPNLTWLLLVPLFNLYWNFKVYPALAESFQAFFYSRGIADVDDCGESLAMWYCILACFWVVPCVNLVTGLASLVFLILFLIKAHDLRDRIPAVEEAA